MAASYVKLFYDFVEKTSRLTDAEVGRLVKAMVIYAKEGVEVDLPGNEDFLFPVFKDQLDKDRAAYAEVSAKRKAAGAKGGKAKVANASKCYQESYNNNDNLNNIMSSVVINNSLESTTVSSGDSTYKATGHSEQVIAIAKNRAAQYGHADDTAYILAILRDWTRQGVRTEDDALRVIAEFDAKKQTNAPAKTTAAHGYQTHGYTDADFGADFYYDPARDFTGAMES